MQDEHDKKYQCIDDTGDRSGLLWNKSGGLGEDGVGEEGGGTYVKWWCGGRNFPATNGEEETDIRDCVWWET